MKNYTMDYRALGSDPALIAQLAALRDRLISFELADRKSAGFRAGQFLRATIGGIPDAAKWCRENGVAIVKASATQPNSAGGVLVPEETANAIISLIEVYGTARPEATTWRMGADHQVVPRATSNFVAGWISENAVMAQAVAAFDGVGLTAKKVGALVTVSSELMEDSIEALGAFFIKGAALAFAQVEDSALFSGDGTSAYGGVTGIATVLSSGAHVGKVVAATGHNTFATLDATDIGAAIAALPARALRNAKLYVSMTGYGSTLVRLAGAAGGLVARIAPDGTLRANWHGLPVVIAQALPTGTGNLTGQMLMVVGDMEQAVAFGVRRDIEVQRFTERYAELDQVLLRATERVDIVAHDLGGSVAAGALVGLFAP